MHMVEKLTANVEMGVDRDGASIKQRVVVEKHSSANDLFFWLGICFKLRALTSKLRSLKVRQSKGLATVVVFRLPLNSTEKGPDQMTALAE